MSNKKYIWLVLCGVCFQIAYAQSYKVKKGEIYKDKELVGTVEGEVGLTHNLDLLFKNLSGEAILHVTEHHFESNYPTIEPAGWYQYNFLQLHKEISIRYVGGFLNEKQFIKYQFANNQIGLYPGGFKSEEMTPLISEDFAMELGRDTLKILAEVAFYQNNLPGEKVERDYTRDPTFLAIPGVSDMYYINQGMNLKSEPYEIGRLAIVTTTEPLGAITTEIIIMKMLVEPVMRDGEKVAFLEVGYIKMGPFCRLFTFQDGVSHRDIEFFSNESMEQIYTKAVKYMIIHEYL